MTGLTAEGDASITTGGGGFIGEAGSFDGVGDAFALDAGLAADLNTGARPVTAWVWLDSGTGDNEMTAVALAQNGVGSKFDFQVNETQDSIEGGVGNGRSTTSGVGFGTDEWEFIAISVGTNRTAGDIIAYLNGGTPIASVANTRAINTGNQDFHIGRSANGAGDGHWKGKIDEVSVWDVQLTDDEIESLYDVANELGYTVSQFNSLKQVHDAGSGSADLGGGAVWQYATGLGSTAGLVDSDTLVLDASAQSGLSRANTDLKARFSRDTPTVNGGGPQYDGTETTPNGWDYMWADTGDIGTSANYVSLQPCTVASPNAAAAPDPMYVADGSLAFNAAGQGNAQYLRVSTGSIHPGAPSVDAQAIAAYTIQAADGEGRYVITNSSVVKQNTSGDGVDLTVFVNNTQVHQLAGFNSTTTTDFDCSLGVLAPGDTVYVAYGNGGSNDSGQDAGAIDFDIYWTASAEPVGTLFRFR